MSSGRTTFDRHKSTTTSSTSSSRRHKLFASLSSSSSARHFRLAASTKAAMTNILSAANIRKPKLANQSRKKCQLRGGHRVTESIRIKPNRIEFDYVTNEILEKSSRTAWPLFANRRSNESPPPHRNPHQSHLQHPRHIKRSHHKHAKVIGRIDDIAEIIVGMKTANFIELRQRINKKNNDNSKNSSSGSSSSSNRRNGSKEKLSKLAPISDDRCLSIVFRDQIVTLDLIAPSATVRELWRQKLSKLLDDRRFDDIRHNFDAFLLQQFRAADLDASGALTFEEISGLLRRLNIVFDELEVRRLFEKANFRKSNSKNANHSIENEVLDIDEFIEFYHLISYTKVLDHEFSRLTKKRYLTKDGLKRILINIQRINTYPPPLTLEAKSTILTDEQIDRFCAQMIEKYEPLAQANNKCETAPIAASGDDHQDDDANGRNQILSSKGFRNLLLSPEFDILSSVSRRVNQDMRRPLTDYYIATSHNTYASENQLDSRSTTETYRIYLTQGCRSVELDMSDGDQSTNFEPVVFHKRTLMNKVKLSAIVQTIATYAFRNSPYPVIISLENNCQNMDSLRKAAQIFRAGFGEQLCTAPLAAAGSDEKRLPSPEDLRGRIIIKGKRLPALNANNTDDNVAELEERHRLAKELSDLVWYGCSRKFISFDDDFRKWNYNEMTSLEEGVSKQHSKSSLAAYRRFTARHLTKVYPYGLRFFSSNFDPLPHWNAGAQMVSLNYQTLSSPMWLNRALFERNGSCGYVLKPASLCIASHALTNQQQQQDDHRRRVVVNHRRRCCFTVKILCAHNLPISSDDRDAAINAYVEIRLFGVRRYKRRHFRTRSVTDNGFSSQWNTQFRFRITDTESALTFVRFRVIDRRIFAASRLIGLRVIAFDSIAEGYRNVTLHDAANRCIEHTKLVVRIDKIWT